MDSNSITIMATTNIEAVAEVLKILSPLMGSVAAIIVSLAAIYGVRAWKREFIGKRKIELAEETLALFYEARDAIAAIRNPFGFAGEGTSRKPQENETEEQKEAWDRAYVAFERYGKHQELFSRLYSTRYRFAVKFGKDKAQPFEEIRIIVNEILIAARMLGDSWAKKVDYLGPKQQKAHLDFRKQQEEIFWEHGSQDELVKRIDQAIADMENTCKKVIMGKGRGGNAVQR